MGFMSLVHLTLPDTYEVSYLAGSTIPQSGFPLETTEVHELHNGHVTPICRCSPATLSLQLFLAAEKPPKMHSMRGYDCGHDPFKDKLPMVLKILHALQDSTGLEALINTAQRPRALPQLGSQPLSLQQQTPAGNAGHTQQQQVPRVSTPANVPPRAATPNGLQMFSGEINSTVSKQAEKGRS